MLDIPVDSLHTMNKGVENVYELKVYVRNLEHLNKLTTELHKQTYISRVERIQR